MNILNFKKYLIFTTYILFNIFLVWILFYVDYGYIILASFIFTSHIKDSFGILYQIIRLGDIVSKNPDIILEKEVKVCALIPTYAEDYKLVKKNVENLVSQNLSKNTKLIIMIICDGLKVREPNKKSLYEYFDNDVTFEDNELKEIKYKFWKTGEKVSLYYKVGIYKDVQVILSYKPKNLGKKDSLIIGEKIIERFGSKIDFVYHTDSDTISDTNCINELLKSMINDPELDGVSGLVRAYYNPDGEHSKWYLGRLWEKSFYVMQDFQYFFSLIARRQTESLINTTVCLPGCCNLIRISDKTKRAIKKYARVPVKSGNFIQTVTRMQGTDRRYTTLLLKEGAKLQMNWRAWVYTEPPLGVKSFVNQRRRWSSNAFFNSIVILYSSSFPLYSRISAFVDVSRLFSTLFRLLSYLTFWIFLRELHYVMITLFSLFLLFPYLYVTIWILSIIPGLDKGKMFLGFLINKLYTPFLSSYTITKMFFTSTNFNWGKVIKEVPNDIENNSDSLEEIVIN